MIGSEKADWVQSYQAVIDAWAAQDPEFFDVTDTKLQRIEAFEDGNVGWAAIEQERTQANGEHFTFRITLVLVLEDWTWRVAQMHYSVAEDDVTLNVELTRTLSDLLATIDSGSGTSPMGTDVVGTATIVFTDLVDSTSLSQDLGDRAWSDLISSHFHAVAEVVGREGGVVVKTIGDGGMYAFASGTSALAAAVGIQQVVAGSGQDGLSLRIGVHTGDVIPDEGDYIGLAVNKAARVAAAAQGDQILVSSTTRELVNTRSHKFGDPITAELKGLEGTHLLWPLDWREAAAPSP
jgi:class 3 adenylate cyclase